MELITDKEALQVRACEIDATAENKRVRDIVLKLKENAREKSLAGLSAPQVGEDARIVVLNFNGDVRTLINPVVAERKGIELSREVCEVDCKQYIIPRNNDISVYYITPLGKMEERRFVGMAAKVLLHQLDLLDGILVEDFGLEVGEDFDNASDEDKDKIICMYLDALDLAQKNMEKAVQEDEGAKQISDAITFIDKVRKGEIEISDDRKVESENENNKNNTD